MPQPLTEFLLTFDRLSLVTEVTAAAKKRAEIVARFSEADWPSLPLERYALGTSKYLESFAWALEFGSPELGSIKGGNANKTLIYYSKDDQGWRYPTKLYPNVETAWSEVRQGFVEALRLGREGRFEQIDDIPALSGGRVFRAKFASVYFPKDIIPVFSKVHLIHFLEELGEAVSAEDSNKTVTLGLRLTKKLGEIPELWNRSNDERAALIYRWNAPPSEPTLLKIAPGERGEYWESDYLPNGVIGVGWEKVGDLRMYPSFEAFRLAFSDAYLAEYNGSEATVTKKAKEVWLLRDLEEGDFVAANRGISEILGLGEVVSPGYIWDTTRESHNHTVKVRWDTTRSGNIEPVRRWALNTVEELKGELRRRVFALPTKVEPPVVPVTSPLPAVTPTTPKPTHSGLPINKIFYGPPGTGKTYRLRQIIADYEEKSTTGSTEEPAIVPKQDREKWIRNLVENEGGERRTVLAAALLEYGPSTIERLRHHELVRAKFSDSQTGKEFNGGIKTALEAFTLESSLGRPSPYHRKDTSKQIFRVDESGQTWSLSSDWETSDPKSSEFVSRYRSIPGDHSGATDDKPVPPPIKGSVYKRHRMVTFHPSYSYEDFVRGIRPVQGGAGEGVEFRMVDGVFKQICDEAASNPGERYALFIDEINRGNIAKIFGELITLIETDKRVRRDAEGNLVSGLEVQLPGSRPGEAPFGVPANLDIYGTMNTADRSIALLDIALRRRFTFEEIGPNYEVLKKVGNIDMGLLLRRINDRLEYLLDRDRRIGHAYLLKVENLAELREVFSQQVIPLLQEYFFDDFSKVALTLSGSGGESAFVKKETLGYEGLFPSNRRTHGEASRDRYLVNPAFKLDRGSLYRPLFLQPRPFLSSLTRGSFHHHGLRA